MVVTRHWGALIEDGGSPGLSSRGGPGVLSSCEGGKNVGGSVVAEWTLVRCELRLVACAREGQPSVENSGSSAGRFPSQRQP